MSRLATRGPSASQRRPRDDGGATASPKRRLRASGNDVKGSVVSARCSALKTTSQGPRQNAQCLSVRASDSRFSLLLAADAFAGVPGSASSPSLPSTA